MSFQKSILFAVLTISSFGVCFPVKADTVKARCDVYPKGEDRATFSGPCTFSQRQGVVGIQLKNGTRYDLVPFGDSPNHYHDQNGQAAHRQSGLGKQGQIYRFFNQSIYVYWDTAPFNKPVSQASVASQPSTKATPITKMTTLNANQLSAQITEGEFNYSGVLNRSSGNTFIGSDGRVRVIYDRGTAKVVIINEATGTEFYNYTYTDVNEGRL